MVETNTASAHPVHNSPPRAVSAENYLSTAMLLNTAQTCNYLGQRLSNLHNERDHEERLQRNQTSPGSRGSHHQTSAASSLFTIDSILAPKPNHLTNRSSESPGSSPPGSANTSPIRPRMPAAMLHHPSLHLGHLAAAAASGFGNTSDFLGKLMELLMSF